MGAGWRKCRAKGASASRFATAAFQRWAFTVSPDQRSPRSGVYQGCRANAPPRPSAALVWLFKPCCALPALPRNAKSPQPPQSAAVPAFET